MTIDTHDRSAPLTPDEAERYQAFLTRRIERAVAEVCRAIDSLRADCPADTHGCPTEADDIRLEGYAAELVMDELADEIREMSLALHAQGYDSDPWLCRADRARRARGAA